VEDCLSRLYYAPPQARTATVEQRRTNVFGAFGCRDSRLQGKMVLLIDDVSTSGATFDSCAAAARAGGPFQSGTFSGQRGLILSPDALE